MMYLPRYHIEFSIQPDVYLIDLSGFSLFVICGGTLFWLCVFIFPPFVECYNSFFAIDVCHAIDVVDLDPPSTDFFCILS